MNIRSLTAKSFSSLTLKLTLPVLLVFIFLISGCGTDSGNPGITAPANAQAPGADASNGDFIGYRLCAKLSSCYSTVPSSCATLILIQPNITNALGINSTTYPDLSSAIAAIKTGALTTNSGTKKTCHEAIDNLSCLSSLVIQAYSVSSPNDLTQTYRLIGASSSCQQIVQ